MARQFIFTMKGVGKVHPPDKVVLRDIWLSFYHGAKIGVLGANGAGKSSLLKIMAGIDTEHLGEARPGDGIRIGFLPQEPVLDPSKDVRGNIEDGLGILRDLIHRFEAISAKFAEPLEPEEMDALLAEQGEVQEKIEAMEGWEIDRKVEIAMDALRCPPGDADVTTLSGGERRRVALCRILLEQPDLLLLDEPTLHLDLAHQVALLAAIRRLREQRGLTVLAVLHDLNLAAAFAPRIAVLDEGRVVADGAPAEVLSPDLVRRVFGVAVDEARTEDGRRHLALRGA